MTEIVLRLAEVAALAGGELAPGSDPELVLGGVVARGDHDRPGSVFVAVTGHAADGHDYLDQAFAGGAAAAVVSDASRFAGRPGVVVADGAAALSRLAAAFAGEPSRRLLTIGVTGTNGKTTVHWLLAHALERLGRPTVRIGSLGIMAPGRYERSSMAAIRGAGQIQMTTPGALEIHDTLRQALAAGVEACVLETSSHALDQCRVADVWYDAAVFTNLSTDHLDYHGDLEQYFQTKVRLFEQLARQRRETGATVGGAAINRDCPWGRRLSGICDRLELPVTSFGTAAEAAVQIVDFAQGFARSRLRLAVAGAEHAIDTVLLGDYNASNLAAAFAVLVCLDFDPAAVAAALSGVPGVPGRLESVGSAAIAVLVDYAHTGDGLRSVLGAVRGFVPNRLWVVFGCGGGKDPRKRRAMGEAARELADKIVLTSDNPRREDPQRIVADILESGCVPAFVELNRAQAIERTLRAAEQGDVVVLAGKGHEDYQVVGDETRHFSDREEVARCRALGLLER